MEDASSSRYTTTTPPPPPPTIPLQLPDSTTAAAEATALQTHHGPSECPTWLSEVDGPARRGDVKVPLLLLRIVGAVVVVGTSVVVLLVVFLPVSSSHEKNNQQSSDPNGTFHCFY